MSWHSAPLGKLADVQLGKMLDQKKNQGEYRRYLGNDNVQWNEFKLDEVKEMRIKDSECERFRLKSGDLLICEGGDPGRCALWTSDEEMYYQKALNRVRVSSEIDARYLLYYFLHIGATREVAQYYTGGATIKHLPNGALKGVIVRYPELEEQRRIASILMAYDNLIENNRRQIALLEEAAALAYVEWSARMDVDSAINGVASDFFDITIGKTPPRSHTECFASEGVPWASVKDLGDAGGPYLRVTSECLTEQAAQQYKVKIKPTGTIVLSFKLTIGRVAILNQPSATNEAIAHFVTDDDAVKLYTYEYLKHFDYESLGSTSSIGKAINSKIVKALPFVMPCRYDLDCLYEILNPIFENMKLCQTRIELAREARDRLLPALMSGEIEV